MFINKTNNNKYIGSSINLANRLCTGYFTRNFQNRVIDSAIKKVLKIPSRQDKSFKDNSEVYLASGWLRLFFR